MTPCSVLKQREGQEPLGALFIRSPVYENPAFVTQSLVESIQNTITLRQDIASIVVERCHDQCKLGKSFLQAHNFREIHGGEHGSGQVGRQ